MSGNEIAARIADEIAASGIELVASLPDGQEIAARLDRNFTAPFGAELPLYADMTMMNLFDP